MSNPKKLLGTLIFSDSTSSKNVRLLILRLQSIQRAAVLIEENVRIRIPTLRFANIQDLVRPLVSPVSILIRAQRHRAPLARHIHFQSQLRAQLASLIHRHHQVHR